MNAAPRMAGRPALLLVALLAAWGYEQAADLRLFGPAYTPAWAASSRAIP